MKVYRLHFALWLSALEFVACNVGDAIRQAKQWAPQVAAYSGPVEIYENGVKIAG